MIAGFISRFIGFFYKIFLSNTIGAKNLGIYQLIFPIYGICYTIYAAGIQTAISKLVASNNNKSDKSCIASPFFTGTAISFFLSLSLSIALYIFSPFISTNILNEPSCKLLLQILSLVFPFCGLTACINGFYYALNKTFIPSLSQLIEQLSRVLTVYIYATFFANNITTCTIAVIGLVVGEFISCIYMIITLLFNKKLTSIFTLYKNHSKKIQFFSVYKFISYTYPLTLNKLFLSTLSTIESIFIPIMLTKYGFSHNNALTTFGILTGMAFSFIMFPSTITNSLSVVLLPTISTVSASNDKNALKDTASKTIHYSFLIGLLSFNLFLFWGQDMGLCVFNNKDAGTYIQILAWLCPFLYTSTTLSSILNGLGKTKITFNNSIISSSIRLIFVLFIIPRLGILGYLLGILASSISLFLLDILFLNKYIPIYINTKSTIIKPAIITLLSGFILKYIYNVLSLSYNISNIILLFSVCALYIFICTIFLFMPPKLFNSHINSNSI